MRYYDRPDYIPGIPLAHQTWLNKPYVAPKREPATEANTTANAWVNPNTATATIAPQVGPNFSVDGHEGADGIPHSGFSADGGDLAGVRPPPTQRIENSGFSSDSGMPSVDFSRFRTPRANEDAAVRVRQWPPDLGLTSESSNYMMFSTFTVKGGIGSGMSDINFDGPHDHVALPIPGPPSTTYEQGWDQKDVGLAGIGLQMAGEAGITAAQGHPGDRTSIATSSAESAIESLMSTGKSALGDAQGIVGTVGKLIGQVGAAQRVSGRASFQNTYVTYTGPGFRTFTYTFSMKPMSAVETYTCRKIVRFFKENSAPTQLGGNVWRIYELPKVFQIKYYDRGGESQFINKIGKCACTSVAVAYGGDRFTTFEDNQGPVQIDLTLAFKEIQLLDSTDVAAFGAGF